MDVMITPLRELLQRGWLFLVNFVTAIVIFVIGWLVAKLIMVLITKLLKSIKLDYLAEETKVAEFLRKGGIKYTLSELLGIVIYWIIILGVLISVLDIMALIGVSTFLDKILLYLPSVIGAIIILILGIFVSAFVATVIRAATANVGVAQAALLAKIAQIAIIVFTVVIALDELKIGTVLVSAMNIVLATVGLALGLAFGLGSKDVAGKLMAEWIDKLKGK
jgi:MFS family permease